MLSHWMATVIQVLPLHRKEMFMTRDTVLRLQAIAGAMGLKKDDGEPNKEQRPEARMLGGGKTRI